MCSQVNLLFAPSEYTDVQEPAGRYTAAVQAGICAALDASG
jgi:hypothetical protein